jgi:hypothetical protein
MLQISAGSIMGYATTAIAIALQHPAVSTTPSILCAIASSCREWRAAVQHCGACNTAVTISAASLLQLSSFARWLPRHPQLVRSITIKPTEGPKSVASTAQAIHVSEQLLQQAMQLASLLPAAGSLAAAAAAPAKQQQQGLRLTSFKSCIIDVTGMLATLPAHSLTHLDITVPSESVINGPAASAALARLTCLQQLSMRGGKAVRGDPVAGLAQLRQLTSLWLLGGWADHHTALQQLLQQQLPLSYLQLSFDGWESPTGPDMSAQIHLREFHTSGILPQGAVLPATLQRLRRDCWLGWHEPAAISSLPQLQHLRLAICSAQGAPLLRLSQLSALQHLALQYFAPSDAAATARTWRQLSCLQELRLDTDTGCNSLQEMQRILKGVKAATNLTKLDLTAVLQVDNDAHDMHNEYVERTVRHIRVAACASLEGLTRLKELCITPQSHLERGDVLALTALTGLTRLVLQGVGSGVGDLAATALACSLRQLQHLDLRDCKLGDMACTAAIAYLTQLTQLQLQGVDDQVSEQALMLLTGLKRLQEFELNPGADTLSAAAITRFWAAQQAM